MKAILINYICKLPYCIKIIISKTYTFFNIKKKRNIKEIYNKNSNSFLELNNKLFKNNMIECMKEILFDADKTKKFIDYLYNDDLKLIKNVEINNQLPTIICVVKNEKEKLINFFRHYDSIGKFNYIFVDNNSTDGTQELLLKKNIRVYLCEEKFSTLRKISWICRVHSTLPLGNWSVLLDADELLVYENCEKMSFNKVIKIFEKNNIEVTGAVMLDMFSSNKCLKKNYFKNYKYFQNEFKETKSYLYNSIYGGIRDREFNYNGKRMFLLKKHPIMKKNNNSLIISCHYIYPFSKNFKSNIYFGLLHYKLFDSEIEKYKKIAQDGTYGNGGGSVEYLAYLNKLNSNKYEEIFKIDSNTIRYTNSKDLENVKIIKKISRINKES